MVQRTQYFRTIGNHYNFLLKRTFSCKPNLKVYIYKFTDFIHSLEACEGFNLPVGPQYLTTYFLEFLSIIHIHFNPPSSHLYVLHIYTVFHLYQAIQNSLVKQCLFYFISKLNNLLFYFVSVMLHQGCRIINYINTCKRSIYGFKLPTLYCIGCISFYNCARIFNFAVFLFYYLFVFNLM